MNHKQVRQVKGQFRETEAAADEAVGPSEPLARTGGAPAGRCPCPRSTPIRSTTDPGHQRGHGCPSRVPAAHALSCDYIVDETQARTLRHRAARGSPQTQRPRSSQAASVLLVTYSKTRVTVFVLITKYTYFYHLELCPLMVPRGRYVVFFKCD